MAAPPPLQVAWPWSGQAVARRLLTLAAGPWTGCPPSFPLGTWISSPLGVGSKAGQPGNPTAGAQVLSG